MVLELCRLLSICLFTFWLVEYIITRIAEYFLVGGDHGEVNKPTNKHIRSTLHILRKKRLPRLETTAAADVKIIHCCFFLGGLWTSLPLLLAGLHFNDHTF